MIRYYKVFNVYLPFSVSLRLSCCSICLPTSSVSLEILTPARGIKTPAAEENSPIAVATSEAEPSPERATIAIISGHAGNDSGATCENNDGDITLTEADTVARIAALAVDELRQRGYNVQLLQEFDERLDGLQVDALVSLHADSCLDNSGFKATYYEKSTKPEVDGRLLECVTTNYTLKTGLLYDANTITEDMTDYHAFRKIDERTPAVILELGYLGGDRALLTRTPSIPADAIAKSIQCFVGAAKE